MLSFHRLCISSLQVKLGNHVCFFLQDCRSLVTSMRVIPNTWESTAPDIWGIWTLSEHTHTYRSEVCTVMVRVFSKEWLLDGRMKTVNARGDRREQRLTSSVWNKSHTTDVYEPFTPKTSLNTCIITILPKPLYTSVYTCVIEGKTSRHHGFLLSLEVECVHSVFSFSHIISLWIWVIYPSSLNYNMTKIHRK